MGCGSPSPLARRRRDLRTGGGGAVWGVCAGADRPAEGRLYPAQGCLRRPRMAWRMAPSVVLWMLSRCAVMLAAAPSGSPALSASTIDLVFLGAALDHARRLGRDPPVLHPQLVEALRHHLEEGVAAQLVDGPMELLVEHAKAERDRRSARTRWPPSRPAWPAPCPRSAPPPGAIIRSRSSGAPDASASTLEFVQRDDELQGRHQAGDGEVGDEAAAALPGLDHAEDGETAQGFRITGRLTWKARASSVSLGSRSPP